MKRMKSLFALALALMTVFVLTACRGGSSDKPSADANPGAQSGGAMLDRLNIGTFDDNRGALLDTGPDSTAIIAQKLVFDMLIYLDPATKMNPIKWTVAVFKNPIK